jgi:hypothetical protein
VPVMDETWAVLIVASVIILGMGWWPCCCGPTFETAECTDDCIDDIAPRYLSFAVAGVGNFTPTQCNGPFGVSDDCTDANGTWIVELLSDCEYTENVLAIDCTTASGGALQFRALINDDAGDEGLQFVVRSTTTVGTPFSVVVYTYRTGSSDTMDCMSEFSGVTLTQSAISSPSPLPYCDWPATVTCNGAV